MELDAKIEAILFWKGEPLTVAELARFLPVPSGELRRALGELEHRLLSTGLRLVQTKDTVALVTAPGAGILIGELRKEELSRDLGKAALETLSIILYRTPISRRDIEYIRGVNSVSILRSLLIRGLIERSQSESYERLFVYRPTVALLSLLGIARTEELPEFDTVKREFDAFSGDEKKESPVLIETVENLGEESNHHGESSENN